MKKLFVSKSGIAGNGLFTKEPIRKGEFICTIEGPVVRWMVTDQKSSHAFPNWIGYGKNHWIDVKGQFVYINHSCSPNVGIKGARRAYALQDISASEELTMDYSITEADTLWEMKCNCKSKRCRKNIRSVQFLPKTIFRKYLPFIPTFFQKAYISQQS